MKIIFENENIIAVFKDAGVLSVPSRLGAEEKRPILGHILQEHLKKQIYPVHRLDEDVSGLIIFALNPTAHRALNKAFEAHQVEKTYEALTEGEAPAQKDFLWESKLVRGKKRSFEAPHGKTAITRASYCGQRPDRLLQWKLYPKTGRSHQLRVHLAKAGFPIAGDELYASKTVFTEAGIALRAVALNFEKAQDLLKGLEIPGKIKVNKEDFFF